MVCYVQYQIASDLNACFGHPKKKQWALLDKRWKIILSDLNPLFAHISALLVSLPCYCLFRLSSRGAKQLVYWCSSSLCPRTQSSVISQIINKSQKFNHSVDYQAAQHFVDLLRNAQYLVSQIQTTVFTCCLYQRKCLDGLWTILFVITSSISQIQSWPWYFNF